MLLMLTKTCLSAMNLGKTWMSHMFKKSNKLEKKDNVGVNDKYTTLLKEELLKIFLFLFWD